MVNSNNKVITFDDVTKVAKTYINEENIALITKAYQFADNAHAGQMRKSGEPFITHLVNVVYILAELQVSPFTLVAGFLHDTIEDCGISKETIAKEFNKEIADLVESVTKVTQLSAMTKEEFQAENHRKIFIAMAKDIRVIIIKLADRVHNMRTLFAQSVEKQKLIAKETLEVYGPIAHRLGINTIKSELDDLSLKYLEPEKYRNIVSLLSKKESERNQQLQVMSDRIIKLLQEHNIPFRISGRIKNIYSIYKKVYLKERIFEEIYDLQALRIITDNETRCYEILGYIHATYRPIPGRFKDYIAMPKPNLYQSLHTTIIGEDGGIFEIQIRTERMDQIAETGIASHWRYKENTSYDPIRVQKEIEEKLAWFRELVTFSNQEGANDAQDYMESLQKDIFEANVYILSPKGRVIDLPNGSTPLDFAYKIHTQVGHNTVGAIVNGVLVPLGTVLKTGDICDIKTSKTNQLPSEGWLKLVKTNQAKNAIRKALMKNDGVENREEILESAKKQIEEMCRLEKLDLKETLKRIEDKKHLQSLKIESLEQFLLAMYNKSINLRAVIDKFKAEDLKIKRDKELELEFLSKKKRATQKITRKTTVIVPGADSIAISFSQCCSPIPGDAIKGYVSKGLGVKIHRADCPNIKLETQRLIDVEWDYDYIASHAQTHYADIQVVAKDRPALLVDIMNHLNASKIIVGMVNAFRNDQGNLAYINLSIQIKNATVLEEIKNSLKSAINDIYEVNRVTKN
jgi:guanosine-3',5'-bis(diphosphate) 3'-pyrophosphohydrolase